jgi:hypothetical protein
MHLLWRDYRSGDSGESKIFKGLIGNKYNRSEEIRPDGNRYALTEKLQKGIDIFRQWSGLKKLPD